MGGKVAPIQRGVAQPRQGRRAYPHCPFRRTQCSFQGHEFDGMQGRQQEALYDEEKPWALEDNP